MKRQTRSVLGVAILVLLAGAVTFAGATLADDRQQIAGTPVEMPVQKDSANATSQTNVTVDTLELHNVTVTNAVVNHVHVTGTVTAGDEAVLETDDAETVESITVRRLRVANATLENVSFSNLTVRNESLGTVLLGNGTTEGEDPAVPRATLKNRTIDGLVIEHGNIGDADVGEMEFQSTAAVGTESNETTGVDAAMEIYSVSIDDATLGNASTVELSIRNETVSGETADGDGES